MSAGPETGQARAVADAVLYEGYLLYPYRASAQKNRSRWQFGVLMPPGYTAVDPSESSALQAQCVFEQGVFEQGEEPAAGVTLRFLQVQRRHTEGAAPDPDTPAVWDEAVEREVTVDVTSAELRAGKSVPFAVPGGEDAELVPGGRLVRRREPLAGTVTVRATPLPGPWRAARLTVRVTSESRLREDALTRDDALPGAMVAAHLIITLAGGAFLSMTDPPEWARPYVGECDNTGCWPVLAGPGNSRQVMLAAPIILPEHPRIAPESPGDLFDGTEIDEILTLRTLALSDAEKAAARATDPRAAALIDRVDAMDAPTMEQLHGTIRAVAGHEEGVPWWDPGADASVSPGTDSVIVSGYRVAAGSRVILRPGSRRADAQDMFLAGREAVVEAVLTDVDDTSYLAVTLSGDPAADLQAAHGRFRYFSPDEVEPCP